MPEFEPKPAHEVHLELLDGAVEQHLETLDLRPTSFHLIMRGKEVLFNQTIGWIAALCGALSRSIIPEKHIQEVTEKLKLIMATPNLQYSPVANNEIDLAIAAIERNRQILQAKNTLAERVGGHQRPLRQYSAT